MTQNCALMTCVNDVLFAINLQIPSSNNTVAQTALQVTFHFVRSLFTITFNVTLEGTSNFISKLIPIVFLKQHPNVLFQLEIKTIIVDTTPLETTLYIENSVHSNRLKRNLYLLSQCNCSGELQSLFSDAR